MTTASPTPSRRASARVPIASESPDLGCRPWMRRGAGPVEEQARPPPPSPSSWFDISSGHGGAGSSHPVIRAAGRPSGAMAPAGGADRRRLPGARADRAGRPAAEPGLLPPAAAARRWAGHRPTQQLRCPRHLLPPGPGPLRARADRSPGRRCTRRSHCSAGHRRRPAEDRVGLGVLFACTGNSARSPIAEALLRHRAGGHVEVVSAGSQPKPRIHPHAVRVLRDRVRHRHLRPVPAAPGHRGRPAVRPCDHSVRQGPRGLPRLRRPSPARPLEHSRPGRHR